MQGIESISCDTMGLGLWIPRKKYQKGTLWKVKVGCDSNSWEINILRPGGLLFIYASIAKNCLNIYLLTLLTHLVNKEADENNPPVEMPISGTCISTISCMNYFVNVIIMLCTCIVCYLCIYCKKKSDTC